MLLIGNRNDVLVDDELAQFRELCARTFDGSASRLVAAHPVDAGREAHFRRETGTGLLQRGEIALEILPADQLQFLERYVDTFGLPQHLQEFRRAECEVASCRRALLLEP